MTTCCNVTVIRIFVVNTLTGYELRVGCVRDIKIVTIFKAGRTVCVSVGDRSGGIL